MTIRDGKAGLPALTRQKTGAVRADPPKKVGRVPRPTPRVGWRVNPPNSPKNKKIKKSV